MFTPPPISAFAEPVVWHQDRAPYFSATFQGEVLRGTVDAASAGVSLGPVTADVWRVHIPHSEDGQSMIAHITMGDTIELPNRPSYRGGGPQRPPVTLTVQSVTVDDSGAWLNCTANERASA